MLGLRTGHKVLCVPFFMHPPYRPLTLSHFPMLSLGTLAIGVDAITPELCSNPLRLMCCAMLYQKSYIVCCYGFTIMTWIHI